MPRPRPLLFAMFALGFASRLTAADLLPADKAVPAVIDHYVEALLKADSIQPAPQTDDYTLIRRLTLDLVGRIPTIAESEAFVKSTEADKRTKLVDRLMASPGYARFQASQFDVMLNATVAGDSGRNSVREYLQMALKDGKTWDVIFRDLMMPDETDPKKKGASAFLKARLQDADRLTNDVSVAFFGVNVSCAQCHDHPLVADWKQDHFFGMKSFLARTYDAAGQIAERPAGLVKFKPTKGPEKTAKLMFLTGATVDTDTNRDLTKDEQKEAGNGKRNKSDKPAPPTPPAFSARAKLVEVALKPAESVFFAKAIANRLWHRFFGYGLVNPLDQMHSENPPSHPELLAWLARDVQTHGYDLTRVVRGIVMSQAYSRSSQYPSESHPLPKYFAVARLKPLAPIQLATSLRIASQDPTSFEKQKPEDFEKRIEGLEGSARGFASMISQPISDDFQIGVGEALLFSNGDRITKEFLTEGGGTILGRLKEKDKEGKTPTTAAAVAMMVQAALARPATPDERDALTAYVNKRNDRTAEAYRQVLWALTTCPEFRFNH